MSWYCPCMPAKQSYLLKCLFLHKVPFYIVFSFVLTLFCDFLFFFFFFFYLFIYFHDYMMIGTLPMKASANTKLTASRLLKSVESDTRNWFNCKKKKKINHASLKGIFSINSKFLSYFERVSSFFFSFTFLEI